MRTSLDAPSKVEKRPAMGRPGPRLKRSQREALAAFLFILPDALGLAIFVALPMLFALSLGFFSVNGFGGFRFVGFANYQRMLIDPLFRQSLWVTFVYVLVLVPALYVTGLGLALLVNRPMPFVGVFRSMFFVPNVVSLVVVALTWQVMLVDKVGFINRLFEFFGLSGYSWLGDPNITLYSILFVTVWFLMGYYMIIFLSGLQEIPREYYDAARIDGAGPASTFFRITLPLLRPTSFFVLLVSLISAVAGSQAFDLIYIMTRGGPANSTSLVIFYQMPKLDRSAKYSSTGYVGQAARPPFLWADPAGLVKLAGMAGCRKRPLVLLFNLLVLPCYVRTITIKVHSVQDDALERVAKAQRISKSELVRRSLEQYLANHQTSSKDTKPNSLHDRLKNYIPKSGTGAKDLASNPKHLEGFGAE